MFLIRDLFLRIYICERLITSSKRTCISVITTVFIYTLIHDVCIFMIFRCYVCTDPHIRNFFLILFMSSSNLLICLSCSLKPDTSLTCMNAYTSICIYVYTRAKYVYAHLYIYIFLVYMHIYICIYVCVYVYVYTHIHTYAHTYIHICAYVNTHFREQKLAQPPSTQEEAAGRSHCSLEGGASGGRCRCRDALQLDIGI